MHKLQLIASQLK